MTRIPAASLKLISNPELIALNQDTLCLQAKVVRREGEVCILVKDLEKEHGLTRAVALYNPTDSVRQVTVDFGELELGGQVTVRDLFARREVAGISGKGLTVNLPARGTRIYKLTGTRRMEPTRYEGENAWLESYQTLVESAATSKPAPLQGASNGYVATHIGDGADRFMKWSDVYSRKGGSYRLTIAYACDRERSLDLTVNGEKAITIDRLSVKEGENIGTCTLNVKLKPGNNEIRIGNDHAAAPDIDCILLVKN